MPTPVFNCCAGCGVVATGATPGSGGVRHWDTVNGAVTIDAATMDSRPSYKFTTAAGASIYLAKNVTGSPTTLVGRIALQFDTLPSGTCRIIEGIPSAGNDPEIEFDAVSGKLFAAIAGTRGATGIAVTTGHRYIIDFKFDVGSGTRTADLTIDGTAAGQASQAVAAGTFNGIRLGLNTFSTTANGTHYISDIILSATSGDYPIGAGKGTALEPAGDGTHSFSASGNFQYHFATNITAGATDTWTMLTGPLDNITDFVAAATATATQYLEWTIGTLPADVVSINGLHITLGQHASATTADAQTVRVIDGASSSDVCTALDQSQTSLTFHSKQYANSVSAGTPWTVTLVNALKFRFLSTDVAPKPALDGIKVEVDYVATAAAVTGSGALSLALAIAATGLVLNPVTGTGALTVTKPALAATAQQSHTGTAATSVPIPTFAGTGTLTYSGTGAMVLSVPQLAATGTVTGGGPAPITGTGAVAVNRPAFSATGTVLNPVSGTGNLAVAPNLAATGQQQHSGTGDLTLTPSLAGTGTSGAPAITGTGDLAITLPIAGTGTYLSNEIGTLGGGGMPSTRNWPFSGVTHYEDGQPVRVPVPEPESPAAPTPASKVGKPKSSPAIEADPWPTAQPTAPIPTVTLSSTLETAEQAVHADQERRAEAQAAADRAAQRAAYEDRQRQRGPVVLVTRYWGGLGLAMLMQRQGSDVTCAFDLRTVKPKELAATKKCGDGLVRKMPLEQALKTFQGQAALWVFDGNDLPDEAERLRHAGEAVVGTSRLSQRLEDDRDFAAQMAEEVGFDLPETEKFTDYAKAIKYLKANADRAFVFKPDKQDPTNTYVPLETGNPGKANAELQAYLQSLTGTKQPSFILQEVVNGLEANVECWLRDGRPVAAWCDLESKRKLVGDLGENVGCAGDYLFALPLDSLAVQSTVGRYLTRPELRHYTGSVDANVMLKDGKVYFLENCFRFGYNAYPTIFQALATRPMEQILREWAVGTGSLDGAFKPGFGASLTLVCDHPKDGLPIIVPPSVRESTYLYRAYQNHHQLGMVEEWAEVVCVTAHGETMAEAGQHCLTLAEQVSFPGKGYRIDLADSTLATLPIPRQQALIQSGFLPGDTEDDEEALTALLGVL